MRPPWVRPAWSPTVRVALLLAALMVVMAAPVDAASAEVIRSGPRSSGAVALTFDDGWGVGACEQIAKTLRKADAKATFFINGNYMKLDPARWRKILKGMPVANHTRSHRNLAAESELIGRKQIKQNEALHEKILGRRVLKILRPPYGAYDKDVLRLASELGYQHVVLWGTSAADTSSAATVKSIVRRTTGARPGTIILMHCARDITAEALPQIIAHYQDRGIALVGLDEMLGMTSGRKSSGKNKTKSRPEPVAQPVPVGVALQRLMSDAVADVVTIIETRAAYG